LFEAGAFAAADGSGRDAFAVAGAAGGIALVDTPARVSDGSGSSVPGVGAADVPFGALSEIAPCPEAGTIDGDSDGWASGGAVSLNNKP
jgi:hypothetical protein